MMRQVPELDDFEDEFEYEVGYKRPTKEHQFKAGNTAAKGRSRKAKKGFASTIRSVLNETVTVTVNNKRKRMTNKELLARKLMNVAQGNGPEALRAARFLSTIYAFDDDVQFMDEVEPSKIVVEFIGRKPVLDIDGN